MLREKATPLVPSPLAGEGGYQPDRIAMPVSFEVNGKYVTVDVEPRMTLVDCLRHELRLTGTHVGCEHGVCGACTILLDGEAVRACLVLAVQAEGCRVVTI